MSEQSTFRDGEFRLDRLSRRAAAVPIGPVRIGEDLVMLRQPRWSDGAAWCRTRRADEDRYRSTFGTTTTSTWVEHYLDVRRGARAGIRVPFLALYGDGRVIGEIDLRLEPTSGSAELSLWFERGTPRAISQWIAASCLFRLLALPARIPRVVAPIAVPNPGPRRLLAHYGFTEVSTARELRDFDDAPTDHDVWWLERNAEHLAGLARGMTDLTL